MQLRDLDPTHDICLCSDGDQAVDVFADGNKNLAGHMAALLSSGCLILNMYSRCSLFDEQFCQFHDSGETAMTSVSIRNDGS